MLRRSPLALKQPPKGEKGRQRRRHMGALNGGFGVVSVSYSRCGTYLEVMELFLREVQDLRVGSWIVAGLGPRELPFSSPHFPSCSTSSGPSPRASSAAAGMPGRNAMVKAKR